MVALVFNLSIFLFSDANICYFAGTGHIREVYFIKLVQNVSSIIFFFIVVLYFVGLLATIAISISAGSANSLLDKKT